MKFSLSIKQFLRLQSLVNSVCRVPGLVIPARDAVRVKGADVIAPPSPAALFCLFEIPAPTPSLKDQGTETGFSQNHIKILSCSAK